MIGMIFVNALTLIVLALLGIALAWGVSRAMDEANERGISNFVGVLSDIQADPMSAAVYYGARWIGICLLVGMLFSRMV